MDDATKALYKAHIEANAAVAAALAASDWQTIADHYNQRNQRGRVPKQELVRAAAQNQVTYNLNKKRYANNTSGDQKALIDEALLLLQGPLDDIDVDDQTFLALFDLLIADAILTAGQKAIITALADSRWTIIRRVAEDQGWPEKPEGTSWQDVRELFR